MTRMGRSGDLMIRAMLVSASHFRENPPCCRYYPSCSNYAIQAVTSFWLPQRRPFAFCVSCAAGLKSRGTDMFAALFHLLYFVVKGL